MSESIVSTLEAPAGKYPPWQGLWDVFINPSRLGKAILQKPMRILPAILVAVTYFLIFFLIKELIIQLSLEQIQERAAQGGPTMDPETVAGATRAFGMAGAVLTGIVLPLIIGLAVWLVGSFGMGLKADFDRIYSGVLYTSWLYAFGSLLLTPLILMNGHLGFSVSLAVLLGEPDLKSPLWILLSKFSLFQIWEVIALGIVSTEIFKTTRNKGYLIAVISLGLLIGISVAFAAIGSMFQPS